MSKIELSGTEASKTPSYREDLFAMLKNVEVVDNRDREGEDVDSTIYDEEGDEFGEEGESGEDEFDEDDDFEDEEDEDDEEFEESEEESEKPRKKRRD